MRNTNRQQAVATRKAYILSRNKKITDRFNQLYNEHRTRYDDCLLALSREYDMSPRSIEGILRQKDKPAPAPTPDNTQPQLFN